MRNKWIANPSIVPKSLWADAFSSSALEDSTGPGILFSILQATVCGLVDTDSASDSLGTTLNAASSMAKAHLEQLVALVAALGESQAHALAQMVAIGESQVPLVAQVAALGESQVQLLAQVAANGEALAQLQAMVVAIVQSDSD